MDSPSAKADGSGSRLQSGCKTKVSKLRYLKVVNFVMNFLLFYVSLHFLIIDRAGCYRKISSCPHVLSPISLPHVQIFLLQFTTAFSLYILYRFRH